MSLDRAAESCDLGAIFLRTEANNIRNTQFAKCDSSVRIVE